MHSDYFDGSMNSNKILQDPSTIERGLVSLLGPFETGVWYHARYHAKARRSQHLKGGAAVSSSPNPQAQRLPLDPEDELVPSPLKPAALGEPCMRPSCFISCPGA